MTTKIEDNHADPLPIGGWLILLAIGVTLLPWRIFYQIYNIYLPIFTEGTFQALIDTNNPAYHPLWKPILLSEAIYNVIFFIVSLVLVHLFYAKKRFFPKFYAIISLTGLIFTLFNAYLITIALPQEPMFSSYTVKVVVQSLIAILIWTPYLFISTRAKNTFVHP